MCCISNHNNPSKSFLNIVSRSEKLFPGLNCLEYLIIIADYSTKIDRHYGFGLFCYGISDFCIIHLVLTRGAVNHYRSCTHMAYGTGSGSVCICRYDNLIAWAYTKYP